LLVAAAESDPAALLTYNDYGFEHDGPDQDRKRDAVLVLRRRLRARNVRIHALGIQSHLTARPGGLHFKELNKFFKELKKLNLQVFITELDVDDRELSSRHRQTRQAVAAVYREYLETVLHHSAAKAILTWDLSDRDTWLNTFHPRRDGLPKRPLPFEASLQAKPAFSAMCEAITAP
jgi:endo-1,4-beta-xylanase